ncbi:DUF6174 domain-containing protein [Thalassotalea euphylliae]|uniref:DUF6174 domain-containing protein n=1 Tax=Thalassotalea euphylliae TaxID=1655234 RepID=UPI00362C31EB
MQIFDNRNPISIIFILVTAIVFIHAFGFAGLQSFNNQNKQAIVSKFETWKRNEPYSYSYKVDSGCMSALSSNVLVVDGVALFEQTSEYELELTIEDIFKQAIKGAAQAASMEVNYHSKYAYPLSIKVDWSKDVTDDECFYSVSNFKEIE